MSVSIEFSCPRREFADPYTPLDWDYVNNKPKPVEGPKLTGLEYVQATYESIETTDGKRIATYVNGDWMLDWPGHKGETYSDFTIWSENPPTPPGATRHYGISFSRSH